MFDHSVKARIIIQIKINNQELICFNWAVVASKYNVILWVDRVDECVLTEKGDLIEPERTEQTGCVVWEEKRGEQQTGTAWKLQHH